MKQNAITSTVHKQHITYLTNAKTTITAFKFTYNTSSKRVQNYSENLYSSSCRQPEFTALDSSQNNELHTILPGDIE